jgi:hypothetical protein
LTTHPDDFERAMIRERQLEGIAEAKEAGKYRGRQSTMTSARYRRSVTGWLLVATKLRRQELNLLRGDDVYNRT